MSSPKLSIEDHLFRRQIQDMLNKLDDKNDHKKAAELLADSLVQTRAALKWMIMQKRN